MALVLAPGRASLLPRRPCRAYRHAVVYAVREDQGPGDDKARSRKGNNFDANNSKRRRGRPAGLRSPYDTPLRDGNRDRLIGLLTDR